MTTRSPFDPLKDAAKYVRAFRDKPFVVKIGGDIIGDPALRKSVCGQLALLHGFAIPLVVVHGGAPTVDALCERLGLTRTKVGGRRITSPEVLEASKMALKGTAQMDLLSAMHAAGLHAVGISGQDAEMLRAHKRPPIVVDGQPVDYGCVGDIDQADPKLLRHLIAGGYVPVVAPFTADVTHQILNTNADTVAAAIAVSLNVEKLFFVVKAPGLLSNPDDPSSLLPLVDLARVQELENSGAIRGGMKPKIAAARAALAGGVHSIHIVSGVLSDAILAEVFTNEGSGTMFVAERSRES
ncbi:MAG: acetylglutamate kinase [Verrucomicrobiota bacterium]|nr:acetylglutamate kinase [Verrucomicrobiota bacterium]